MKVVVQRQVHKKLRELLKALLDKGYFAIRENAEQYVFKVYDAVITLPTLHFRETKDTSYGHYYAIYKPNRHTTRYILFDVKGDQYIVRNIIINHTPDYPKFIASLK